VGLSKLSQTIITYHTPTDANAPALLYAGEFATGTGPTYTRMWLGDGTTNRLLLSNNPSEGSIFGGPFLPLSGGNLTGQLAVGGNGIAYFGFGSLVAFGWDGAHVLASIDGTGSPGALVSLTELDALAGVLTLCGEYDAATDTVIPSRNIGPGPLPPASAANEGWYLIVTTGGTGIGNAPPGANFTVGDWVVSNGIAWIWLDLHQPATVAANVEVLPAVIGQTNVQSALQTLAASVAGGPFLPLTGGGLSGGLSFGATVVTNPADLTRHIQLYDAYTGLSVTGGRLNIVSAGVTVFVSGDIAANTDVATFSAGGVQMGLGTAITLATDPAAPMQAATRQYVDAHRDPGGPFLPLTGGTISGSIAVNGETAVTNGIRYNGSNIIGFGWTGGFVDASVDGSGTPGALAHTSWVASQFLALAGGTMAGQILTLPPVGPQDAVNKEYVDTSIAALRNFIGTWQVAANAPDITAGAPTPGDYYIAVTASPTVPETAPAGIPGIAGQVINNGDMVIWDAVGLIWELIRGGPLTVAEANALYLQLTGGTMGGPLLLASDPIVPLEAATRNYVDSRVGNYLPLLGGTMTGPLVLPDGTTTVPALQFGTPDDTGFWRSGASLAINIQAVPTVAFTPTLTQFYMPVSLLSNRIQQLADPINPTDALNLRTGDARYLGQAGGGGNIGATPPTSPADGDFWWDSVSGNLFIYYNDGTSSQWVPATTGGGGGGSGGGGNFLPLDGGTLAGNLTIGGLQVPPPLPTTTPLFIAPFMSLAVSGALNFNRYPTHPTNGGGNYIAAGFSGRINLDAATGSIVFISNPTGGADAVANTTAGNWAMAQNGTFTSNRGPVAGNGPYNDISDISIKRDVEPTIIGLAEILNLEPIDFTRISGIRRETGFSAQQVQPIIPRAVGEIDGLLTVVSTPIIAALVNAVKELHAMIQVQR
jgi:hypothetical protein